MAVTSAWPGDPLCEQCAVARWCDSAPLFLAAFGEAPMKAVTGDRDSAR